MLNDQQVTDLVRRTNPVPDPERVPEPRYTALVLLDVARKERAMKTHPRTELPTDAEPTRPRRWLRPAAAFGGALVLMLGAIGVIALISGGEPEVAADPTVTTASETTVTEAPVASTTVAPVTTAPTTAAPEPPPPTPAEVFAGGNWSESSREGEFWISRIVPTGLGLFATDGQTIVMSADGLDWDIVFAAPVEYLDPQPSDTLPGESPLRTVDGQVGPIVEFDSAVHAFGSVATIDHTRGERTLDFYTWRSENGTDWEQIPLPPTRVDECCLDGAVALDGRIVAFLAWGGGSPVWVSDDGRDWSVAENEQTGLDDLAANSVIAYGEGLLAVGAVEEPEEARYVHTSPDGEVWTRGYRFGADEYPVKSAFVLSDGTLLLGGFTFDQTSDADIVPAVWRSRDGKAFERMSMPAEVLGNSPQFVMTDYGLLGVVSMGPYESDDPWRISFVALGEDGEFSLIDPGAPASLTEGLNLWDVAFFDGKLILVGESVSDPGVPHTWVWTPAS